MTGVVHIVGTVIDIGTRTRQCCAWCGAILLDGDAAFGAAEAGHDPRPPHFPPGVLLLVDGNRKAVIEHQDGDPLPENACALRTPSVTQLAELKRLTGQIEAPCPRRWGDPNQWPYCSKNPNGGHECMLSSFPHPHHVCKCGNDHNERVVEATG